MFLGFILPVIVGTWLSLSFEYLCAREEEESFVGNFAAGSPRLLLCILEHINILGDPIYFKVIALHLIIQYQEVEGMETCAPHLEVGKKRLWRDVSVKILRVLEFPHPRVSDNGKDELCSLLPLRLVGATVGSLGFVLCFRAHTYNKRGIVVDRCIVIAHSCGFEEFRAVARCVRCHRSNEADEVVCASRFVVRDFKEERHHNLPDSCEVGVGWLTIYRLECF